MKKLLLPFCVLFSVLGNAQTWTNYTVANTSTNIIGNNITDVIKDRDGKMWFSSLGGVSCYDGQKWTNHLLKDSLNMYYVTALAIDLGGNIWAGTRENGVAKFDGIKWIYYTTTNGLIDNSISCIEIDSKGIIWFGTTTGISKFDGEKWTSYTDLGSVLIEDIAVDKSGMKYFVAENNLYVFNDTVWGRRFTFLNRVHEVFVDKNDVKWIGYDGYLAKTNDTNNLITPFIVPGNAISIKEIESDELGNIFLGTNEGVFKFDGKNWNYLIRKNNVREDILEQNVNAISFDNNGHLWAGTSFGACNNDGNKWTYFFPDKLQDYYIKDIIVDVKEDVWFSTFLSQSKLSDKEWINYTDADSTNYSSVSTSAIDEKGIVWFGTNNNRISSFNGINWIHYTLPVPNNAPNERIIRDIAIDNFGNKWLATNYGLVKFDGVTWTRYLPKDTFSKFDNDIGDIEFDLNGVLWLTTTEGLIKFDGTNFVNYYKDKDDYIDYYSSLSIDEFGNRWIGTAFGVLKFDGTSWTNYTTQDGLASNNVNDIKIDRDGTKWFATNEGVSKFNNSTWKTYKPDSLFSVYHVNRIAIDNNGNKWFGSQYGISKFSDNGSGPLNLNQIQRGLVFHDLNANSKKDSNESNISGHIVKVVDNYTTTQNNGLFYTSLNNGTHTFTYHPQANWKLTTDSSITITVTDAPIKDTLYFGVQAIANKNEVETKLTGTATRSGFESKSWINYTNLGTLAENGTVSYTLAVEASLVQSIPVADSSIEKRLVWKYSNLIPNEQRQISIITQMPSVNFMGDTLVSISRIKSAFSENSDTLKQVLTAAYDPNDKLVAQGIGSKGYVLFGKELEYTVRFQNTGTDTAFNVNIRDTLDLNLDVASLQIVASSHPVKLDLRGQNEATFRFENILLPDSNVNQLGSNGFVKYTIKPKKNLPENTSVKNKAHIYFDFNPAIITNETENTYVSKLPSSLVTGIQGFQSNKSATIFPNPTKEEFTIVFPQSGTYEISLANIQGKSIKTWNEIVGQETTLSLEGLEPGMYLYTAQGRDGQKYMGKLVVGR